MPTIEYIQADGTARTVDVADGTSIMRAALAGGVDGIIGECGGQAMCATCHVYVQGDPELPEIGDEEEEMLEETAAERRENSRLGCQLKAGRDFDAITVAVPDTQV